MPGRKDKKGDRKRTREKGDGGTGNLAAMFGLGGADLGVDDADLEAELLALEGKAPKRGGKSPKQGGKGIMSMAEVDSMVAGLGNIGDVGGEDDDEDDEDLSDIDDEDLLGELEALEKDVDMETEPIELKPTPPAPSPRSRSGGGAVPSRPSPGQKSGGGGAAAGGGDVAVISERLQQYQQAQKQAESAGEGTKARRYKRSIGSLEQVLKSARSGKRINLDDIPPPVAVKPSTTSQPRQEPAAATPPKPKPRLSPSTTPSRPPPNLAALDDPEFDEFTLSEDDIAAMSSSLVDDRQKEQPPQSSSSSLKPAAPVAAPRQQQRGDSVGVISERLQQYQQALKQAESTGEGTKARRYKRSIGNLEQSLKSARAGKQVNLDDLPPPVSVPPPAAATPPTASLPHPQATPPQAQPTKISPSPTAPPKPSPKPRSQAASKPPPPGLIDLDSPEFDEFNISEDDLAAMAAAFVDDRAKRPKLEEEQPPQASGGAQKTGGLSPQKPTTSLSSTSPATKSLPARLTAPPQDGDKSSLRAMLLERKEQYQSAAKKDSSKNREYRLMAAQFARVVKGMDQGQEVDLSKMPGPPPGYKSSYNIDTSKFVPKPKPQQATPPAAQASGSAEPEDEAPVDPEIPLPRTALEALEQRLAKYKEGSRSAQEKGETSRVRRMGRIIKQYEEAIKFTKAGKLYNYDDLPAPPGFPPIPAASKPVRRAQPVVAAPPTQSLPVVAARQGRAPPTSAQPSISQQQIELVATRRQELLTAAKQAQAKNKKEEALHYLKLKKGLDRMLELARSGFPVNLEEIPPSPFADISRTKPAMGVLSHLKPASEGDDETFDLIEKQLQKQIDVCNRNSEAHEKMGSTASAIQYQNMSQNCQRELLALKGIQSQNLAPPKFTMETRTFVIVHTNSHLSSQVCEIEVVQGLNIPKPQGYEEKDLSVYVEIEFPWPSEDPPKETTSSAKKSCNPQFDEQKFQFEIDRKRVKGMLRTFKRTPVKCCVYQSRTLRRDVFLGQALVPLEALEKKCEHRVTTDLKDEKGRKTIGGQLEVVARLREPLTGRDEEQCEEQWLVFKEAIAAKSAVSMPKLTKPSPTKGGASGGSSANFALLSPVKVENTTSLEALRFELSLVQSAIKGGHKDTATVQRGRQIQARMETLKQRLQADPRFRQSFAKQVTKELHTEQQLEAQLVKQGKGKQAEVIILQKRRAAMEKEIKALQERKL